MSVHGKVETEQDNVGMGGSPWEARELPHIQGWGWLGCDFLVVIANALWSLSGLTPIL